MIEKVILKTRLKTLLGKIVELFLSMLFILFREQFFFFKRRKKKVSNLEDGSNVLRNNVANIGFIRFEEGSRFQEAPPSKHRVPRIPGGLLRGKQHSLHSRWLAIRITNTRVYTARALGAQLGLGLMPDISREIHHKPLGARTRLAPPPSLQRRCTPDGRNYRYKSVVFL